MLTFLKKNLKNYSKHSIAKLEVKDAEQLKEMEHKVKSGSLGNLVPK